MGAAKVINKAEETAILISAWGRPPKGHRLMIEAILHRLRVGCPWRDLAQGFGSWSRVDTREWSQTKGMTATPCGIALPPRRQDLHRAQVESPNEGSISSELLSAAPPSGEPVPTVEKVPCGGYPP